MKNSKKIATVIGARPQFIKAAPVSRAFAIHNKSTERIRPKVDEIIIHTGQHFDTNMSEIFFEQLEIPTPNYNLGIGGGSHGQNTGRMIENIESVLIDERPDWVLVYGDTDSTIAGALAAAKLHVPVAHVEAGLRSFNWRMPEEINRVLTDHMATILFCPTKMSVDNLKKEGFPRKISRTTEQIIAEVGDVMYDAALYYGKIAAAKSIILKRMELVPHEFILATIHRSENTDQPRKLTAIFDGLAEVARNYKVVMPLHPRTKKYLDMLDTSLITHYSSLITFLSPLGYLDMVMLEMNAGLIATDSGGVQKEAYFYGVPCVTLREETEWIELVDMGWNRIASPGDVNIERCIIDAFGTKGEDGLFYGDGSAAEKICRMLTEENEAKVFNIE